MMNETTMKKARALIDRIDLSDENFRIEQLFAEREELEASLVRADDRRKAALRDLNEARDKQQVNAVAVADSLLAGTEAREAAEAGPSIDELKDEIASLRAGIGELSRRISTVKNEIANEQAKAQHKIAAATKPLADAIATEMAEASKRLLDCYAAATALTDASGGHGIILHAARQAVSGVMGIDKPLPGARQLVEVPRDLSALLATLGEKGPAHKPRLTTSVLTPL